jgi:hypothetical protein
MHLQRGACGLHGAVLPADSVNEKVTRGKLKSAVERAITKKTVVILDSLNNIKVNRFGSEEPLVLPWAFAPGARRTRSQQQPTPLLPYSMLSGLPV